jgi:hypothetical protein
MTEAAGAARRTRSATSTLASDLAALPRQSYAELQAEWRRLYRSPPPKQTSRDLLELGIAWALQDKALGGLTPAARRQLAALAETLGRGGDIAAPRTTSLKAGARLVREWNGETHDVLVLKDGFRWRDATWPSLSAIAREITGARWSGPRFFGITASRSRPATDHGPRRVADAEASCG